MENLNSLGLVHAIIKHHVKPGDFCIDATAGRGGDTQFLCELAGKEGKVIAFDIQPEAVESTKNRLNECGYTDTGKVFLDSHANMDKYAAEESVSVIVFNFGWLPGGNHNIFTMPETSIEAINKGLKLLKKGGLMALCIYYGRETGYNERDKLLDFFKTIDSKYYTVVVSEFTNRTNCPPIPVFITKE